MQRKSNRGVVQLASILAWGASGRPFESGHSDQVFQKLAETFSETSLFFVYIIFLLISLLHLFTVWMLSSRMAAISLLLRSEQERSRTFASVSLRLGYLC